MLVIFAKLDIPASDSAWIEAIRKRYDPQQQMVEPHVTFVFPFEGTSPAEVVAHAEAVARDARPIAFLLSKAAAVRDLDGPGSHLFLLPEDGAPEMRALHARLYSGLLAQKLHPTAKYLPHVTVGAFQRHDDAERAAASLPAVNIRGALRALQIAFFDGVRVESLREAPLGGR